MLNAKKSTPPELLMMRPLPPLRIGSYNLRVDHTADVGTIHAWPRRRPMLVSAIESLFCSLLAVQEPSPLQAADLQNDLGPRWGVAVTPCDPGAWAASGPAGPADGQARDGNGFIWDTERLELLEPLVTKWLSPDPTSPWQAEARHGGKGAWGGSRYERTVVIGRFRDRLSSATIVALSAHFDHEGDDDVGTSGSEARVRSAELVMQLALAEAETGVAVPAREEGAVAEAAPPDLVAVCGDFNTFQDRTGQCYAALAHHGRRTSRATGAAAGSVSGSASELFFEDVRDVAGVEEVDSGRGGASWEGWETNAFCRARGLAGATNRFDQMFVHFGGGTGGGDCGDASPRVRLSLRRTTVVEQTFAVVGDGGGIGSRDGSGRDGTGGGGAGEEGSISPKNTDRVYASDHLPVVADFDLISAAGC